MSRKDSLLKKIQQTPTPKNFKVRELDSLMAKCGCKKGSGGRGSSIVYFHENTGKILTFDQPHPGEELYRYQIKKVIKYLEDL